MINRSIFVRAVFKGTDSLGYEKNKEYKLSIRHRHETPASPFVIIHRDDERFGQGFCEYSSMLTFLDNWDCIRTT